MQYMNLPDLLGLHYGNPLGLPPLACLIIILVLVETMAVFNFFIRHRGKAQYYPVLYTLFGLSLLAVFYYCFLGSLPAMKFGPEAGMPCIGWFCRKSIVGLGWAIAGVVLATHVAFTLLTAAMQITAQLSVEAGMTVEKKQWKEWKVGLFILMLGLSVAAICYAIKPMSQLAFIAMVVALALTVAFVLYKIVRDTVVTGRFLWALLIGLAFLLGALAAGMIITEVLHACIFVVVLVAVYLGGAKARKKKAYTGQ